jgi:hypothetical protein
MEVDTEEHLLSTAPCSPEHEYYCEQVCREALLKRILEMSKPYKADIEKMDDLLKWKFGIFMRPVFHKEENGLTAYQCFWDWDTKGVSLPESLEDPELLMDLVQAKRNREFTIDQWVETFSFRDEYPIWPEEYLSHPGMDLVLFRKLFGRDPNPEIVKALKTS